MYKFIHHWLITIVHVQQLYKRLFMQPKCLLQLSCRLKTGLRDLSRENIRRFRLYVTTRDHSCLACHWRISWFLWLLLHPCFVSAFEMFPPQNKHKLTKWFASNPRQLVFCEDNLLCLCWRHRRRFFRRRSREKRTAVARFNATACFSNVLTFCVGKPVWPDP